MRAEVKKKEERKKNWNTILRWRAFHSNFSFKMLFRQVQIYFLEEEGKKKGAPFPRNETGNISSCLKKKEKKKQLQF